MQGEMKLVKYCSTNSAVTWIIEYYSHLYIQYLLLRRVDINSDEFSRQLRPFLMERTEHFVHEFFSFARSPFDMATYDERAQYSWPESTDGPTPGSETPTVFHSSSAGVLGLRVKLSKYQDSLFVPKY